MSHARSGSNINYATAIKYDHSKRNNLRKFAAGWLYGLGTLSKISAAELKKVKAYMPSNAAPSRALAKSKSCEGVTQTETYYHGSDFWNRYWMSSCRTDAVAFNMSAVAGTAGVMAIATAEDVPVAIVLGLVAAAFELGAKALADAAKESSVHGVIVNDRWHLVWVKPQ